MGVLHISIHAPREGRDLPSFLIATPQTSNFNPRAPRGARPRRKLISINPENFNPRAPRGARRCTFEGKTYTAYISIHAPREGRDGNSSFRVVGFREISIHAPREGRDVLRLLALRAEVISIHAPREGRDARR